MNLDAITDLELLRAAAKVYEAGFRQAVTENKALKQRIAELNGPDGEQLEMRVSELEHQVAVRNRLLFADKSEKRSSGAKSKSQKPQTGHGPRPQPELPVMEAVHRLEEADQVCPQCGERLEEWEGQSEDSEQIESVTRAFLRRPIPAVSRPP